MTFKNVIGLAMAAFSLTGFAAATNDSVQAAKELYALRAEVRSGPEASFALESAEMYERLAAAETDLEQKAELINRQSEALYWVGTHSPAAQSIAYHKKGFEVAQSLFSAEKKLSKEKLAEAHYLYGANLGKWGEPQSTMVKAENWPKLKASMDKIIALGQNATQDYGVHRILGRAYFKLPWPLGSNTDSVNHLKTAVNNTLAVVNGVTQKFSKHGTNNTFLAETLIAIGGDEELELAEEILKGYLAADLATLYPERLPENKEEVAIAKKLLESI